MTDDAIKTQVQGSRSQLHADASYALVLLVDVLLLIMRVYACGL